LLPASGKALDPNKQILPTDFFVEPDDLNSMFWDAGRERSPTSSNAKGQLDGDFGHGVPMN